MTRQFDIAAAAEGQLAQGTPEFRAVAEGRHSFEFQPVHIGKPFQNAPVENGVLRVEGKLQRSDFFLNRKGQQFPAGSVVKREAFILNRRGCLNPERLLARRNPFFNGSASGAHKPFRRERRLGKSGDIQRASGDCDELAALKRTENGEVEFHRRLLLRRSYRIVQCAHAAGQFYDLGRCPEIVAAHQLPGQFRLRLPVVVGGINARPVRIGMGIRIYPA